MIKIAVWIRTSDKEVDPITSNDAGQGFRVSNEVGADNVERC
jgi:hypothetical protein